MSFAGKIRGGENLAKRLAGIQVDMQGLSRDDILDATLGIHAEALKSIQAQGSGSREMRYNPERMVRVSLPGQPPNTDTGTLVSSIQFDFKNGIGRVGTNLKYGAYLEFGTSDMAARPWLQPAFLKVTKDLAKKMKQNLKKALQRAG